VEEKVLCAVLHAGTLFPLRCCKCLMKWSVTISSPSYNTQAYISIISIARSLGPPPYIIAEICSRGAEAKLAEKP